MLDDEVRRQPNEYEPDDCVEWVRRLEFTKATKIRQGCPMCGTRLLGAEYAVLQHLRLRHAYRDEEAARVAGALRAALARLEL